MAATAPPNVEWPKKTREIHNHHMDSTVWNDFKPRKDDIVIATHMKAGTTWTQHIVAQLLFNGDETVKAWELSPWVDLRVPPKEVQLANLEAQSHRRFLKTHLPVDALPIFPEVKYLYVLRDGRDVVMSIYNHHANANDEWYNMLNNTPGLVGPPIERPTPDIRQYFREFVEKDGYPFWSFFSATRSWWEIRHLPNVMIVHYQQMKDDLAGQIRRMARFLDIPIDESNFPTILDHCSFEYMKEHADNVVPLAGKIFEGGAKTFINKGTNGRWRDVLTAEDVAYYEKKAKEEFGEELANFVATGKWPEGDPHNKTF